MARYRVYSLNRCELIRIGEIEADADEEAVRIAKAHGTGDRVEIWQGGRRVRVVAPAGRRQR